MQPLLAAGKLHPDNGAADSKRGARGSHPIRRRLVPEDWHFWNAVAGVARLRYLPRVLATYRKSRTGRSRIPKASRAISRNLELPLRLNLGCGTPGTRSWQPIPGMCKLDKSMGWRYQDGLAEFVTGSVAGITISQFAHVCGAARLAGSFRRVRARAGARRRDPDHRGRCDFAGKLARRRLARIAAGSSAHRCSDGHGRYAARRPSGGDA